MSSRHIAGPPGNLGRVLVIGGCGYLGNNLVRQLLDDGNATEISVIDIKIGRKRHANVAYFEMDICDGDKLLLTLNEICPEVVFHTASPPAFGFDLQFYERINVGGTQNLLRVVTATGSTKVFVYTSSAFVLFDGSNDLINADETAPVILLPKQRSIYSHSKAIAERAVLQANRKYGDLLTCSIRLSGMFGEDDPTSTKPVVDAAATGKLRYQFGDGKNLFDRTYVGNVVQAHLRAAHLLSLSHGSPSSTTPVDQRVDGEAFIITNDEPIRFWAFARELGAAAGHPTPVEDLRIIPKWLGLAIVTVMEWMIWITSLGKQDSTPVSAGIRYSMISRTYNIEKAKKRLGYRPTVDMTEGIRKAGESFSQRYKKLD